MARAKKNTGAKAMVANQKTRATGSNSGGGGLREADAEACGLEVDPVVRARVKKCWAGIEI